MTASVIYRLVSKLYELASENDIQTLDAAAKYITTTFEPGQKDAFLTVLDGLRRLRESTSADGQGLPSVVATSRWTGPGAPADPRARELEAILDDQQFLPSKRSLVAFINSVFGGLVNMEHVGKSSRADLARRALSAFRRSDEPVKRQLFAAARSQYIRERAASLTDWSRIITKDD